jgi:hypothetical protein
MSFNDENDGYRGNQGYRGRSYRGGGGGGGRDGGGGGGGYRGRSGPSRGGYDNRGGGGYDNRGGGGRGGDRDRDGGGYSQRRQPQQPPLHTEKLYAERKVFFLDLKENDRGRVVKITEDVRGRRDTVMVPIEMLQDFMVSLQRISEFDATGEITTPEPVRNRYQDDNGDQGDGYYDSGSDQSGDEQQADESEDSQAYSSDR